MFSRVGTLILLSHDISDVFLEGGKLVRYDAHNKNMTNFMFVLFFTSWVLTRLIYYPFIVIRSAVTEAAALIQPDYVIWDLGLVSFSRAFFGWKSGQLLGLVSKFIVLALKHGGYSFKIRLAGPILDFFTGSH